MTEMTNAGECHGYAVLIGSGDHFLVADAAAGLNDRGRARFYDDIQSIPEWEKGIRCHNRLCQCESGLLCFDGCDARLS